MLGVYIMQTASLLFEGLIIFVLLKKVFAVINGRQLNHGPFLYNDKRFGNFLN